MGPLQIIFLLAAALVLGAAILVVTTRNLVHAALWLIVALFGVAVLYVLLNASFFAVVQIVIYIGAIAILFIFAVMLTRRIGAKDIGPQNNPNWWLAALLALLMLGGLATIFLSWPAFNTPLPPLSNQVDLIAALGKSLVTTYLLPFELASVLLVAALIGAIFVSWERK